MTARIVDSRGAAKVEGDPANSRYSFRRADRTSHVTDKPRAKLVTIQVELRSRQ